MNIDFTGNLKRICKEKGLQLKELADKLEMSSVSLSRIINNDNQTLNTVKKFAEALNVEPSEILFGIKDATPDQITPANNICPHCGKRISIKLEKE